MKVQTYDKFNCVWLDAQNDGRIDFYDADGRHYRIQESADGSLALVVMNGALTMRPWDYNALSFKAA